MPSSLKVLIVSTNADAAGAPLHVQALVANLQDQVAWHAVFGEEGPVARQLRDRGIPVTVIPTMRSEISPMKDLRSLLALRRVVRGFQPHVIHVHSSKAGMLGRALGAWLRLPVLYTVHGWGWRGMGRISRALIIFIERVLRFTPKSRYLYVAAAVEREAREVLGVSALQGRVVYNGVPDCWQTPRSAASRQGSLRILMAARVSLAKDHESLVRAFELWPYPAELVLCGAGTDEAAFRADVQRWAPRRHVNVLCLGSRSDVPELLASSDIFALISHFEALPLSIIEAMAAGLPTVASNVGGVSELIEPGVHGFLVGAPVVADIVRALVALQDCALRQRMGEQARQRFLHRFTSDIMCQQTLAFYHEMVKDNPA